MNSRDNETEQRLADLEDMLSTGLDPANADDDLGRERIEAYRAGLQFAVDYLKDGPDHPEAEVIPLQRP